MFSLWKFRRTFGFYPWSVRDPAREKLIQLRLNQLREARDRADSLFQELEPKLAEVNTVEEGITLSRQVANAEWAYDAADKRLYQACKLAVHYEIYRPVAQVGNESLIPNDERATI